MKTTALPLVLISSLALPFVVAAQNEPVPTIVSAEMRDGTTIMDIVFQVDDPDDATVRVRALAFVDGVRSFANVILPVTFVEGTEASLGDSIATGVQHTISWNVGADWDIDLGELKFEILCRDGRGLLPFEWITIPAAGGEPELTISKNSPTDAEVLDAFFWQYADGDPGLELVDGVVSGTTSSGLTMALVRGATIENYAIPYILKDLNLAAADLRSINHAVDARSPITNSDSWHALNSAWQNLDILVGWGRNDYGAATVPSSIVISEVSAFIGGNRHSLALLNDGTVFAWGENTLYGETTIPSGLENVTAISTLVYHNLALLGDGTVVGWGLNTSGEATPPEGLANVAAISAGSGHSLALLNDGTVVGWGSDEFGQSSPPDGISNVTAIAAGGQHSLVLLDDGTVVAWGRDDLGQSSPPDGLTNVVAIAAGPHHNLALLNDGTVIGWGWNEDNQASPPIDLANVTAISAGINHSLALLEDGTVIAWGSDAYGQTTTPEGIANVTTIATGVWHNLVLLEDTNP